ncbi:MAG: sugar-binding transcriptional regulator [Alphaproteobacteria bacterium]
MAKQGNRRHTGRAMAADAEDRLRTRAAWLYYIEGLTQEQVAQKLNKSRLKITRTLADCRDLGVVQFRINSKLADCIELERRLETELGLTEAVVVPHSDDPENLAAAIGNAAGAYLSENLSDGLTVGVGWGMTLQHSLRSTFHKPIENLTIVSLLGGLTYAAALSPAEFAWRLAGQLDAACFHIAAPVFTSNAATRRSLMSQRGLRDLFEHASRVDMAMLSVGDLSEGATIVQCGLLDPEELASLREAGAVGDVLCHFVDGSGAFVDHPINKRVMAYNPKLLRKIPKVVLASGSVRKVPVLLAAIKLTQAHTLITDDSTAIEMLRQAAAD